MKRGLEFVVRSFLAGFLIIVPIYLAVLLLLKAMKSVVGLVKPVAKLLPDSVPAETLLTLLLVLVICFLVGLVVRTRMGSSLRQKLEKSLFERIPGYALIRSLTQQLTGTSQEKVWQPALVEIEDALVPGFIIEEFDDGRYTVFIPSIPTPLAGAVYILERTRVHPLDVPFTNALKVISKWGSGSKELAEAMDRGKVLTRQAAH